MATAIEVAGVTKRFRLYHEKYTSLKERVIHLGKVPYEEFLALDEVNITVPEGQTLGLVGRNGSGKSTLLKCIAAILQPTSGRIVVRGQLASMLELGAGFHPELSGRENIFLNGSLLGMPRRDIERRFDEIVAFAELEQFIDNQVKYYSSGMYTRLGFAVAVNVDPDILLIDEVLAVGDEAFQRKCLDRVRQFQREGRTIIIVSHAAEHVRQVCDRAVVLDHGRMVADAAPGEAIATFREEVLAVDDAGAVLLGAETAPGGGLSDRAPVRITSVEHEHPGTGSRPYLLPGEALGVHVAFEAAGQVHDAVFTIAVHDSNGVLIYGADTEVLGGETAVLSGSGEVTFRFDSVPLLDGGYDVSIGVRSQEGGVVYDWRERATRFEVMNPGRESGSVSLPARVEIHAEPATHPAARSLSEPVLQSETGRASL